MQAWPQSRQLLRRWHVNVRDSPKMKHLLSIEKLTRAEIEKILADAAGLKQKRGKSEPQSLAGQTWAMIFSKASTRTRVSFEVGIRELGGHAVFLPASE